MIKIDKKIPIPAEITRRRPYNKLPYGTMEVGESFLYPIHENGITYSQASAMSATRRYPDRRFATKIVEEKGQRVVRVWRIA